MYVSPNLVPIFCHVANSLIEYMVFLPAKSILQSFEKHRPHSEVRFAIARLVSSGSINIAPRTTTVSSNAAM